MNYITILLMDILAFFSPDFLYSYFSGEWEISRKVWLKKALYAKASGFAEFKLIEKNNILEFNESGYLELSGKKSQIAFSKSFLYEFENSKFQVFFNDGLNKGRLYQKYEYDLDKVKIVSVCEHLCVEDIYNAEYELQNHDHFLHQSTIEGPSKDFFIETFFTRKK